MREKEKQVYESERESESDRQSPIGEKKKKGKSSLLALFSKCGSSLRNSYRAYFYYGWSYSANDSAVTPRAVARPKRENSRKKPGCSESFVAFAEAFCVISTFADAYRRRYSCLETESEPRTTLALVRHVNYEVDAPGASHSAPDDSEASLCKTRAPMRGIFALLSRDEELPRSAHWKFQ